MRLALSLSLVFSLFGCKTRDESSLASASRNNGPAEFGATANWENDRLTFVRTKSVGDFLNLSVVRFAEERSGSFELYGKKVSYPPIKSKCVVQGKDYTCDRDTKNPIFGAKQDFGPALKFVKKTGNQSVYKGTWPCSKVIEFVSEKPGKSSKQCEITATTRPDRKKVAFNVTVKGGFGLTANGNDLDVLPMPFVNQPLQKEVVLAAMKRIRERWPDAAVEALNANVPNKQVGMRELVNSGTIVSCNENYVPWWSDIVVHYYCQFPGGIRECFTGSVRGGYDYIYRPYFTLIPGLEGTSLGGAFDFCLHDGASNKKLPFYERFASPNDIPDNGKRGNYKWLAVTPVLDDNGQPFLNSAGKEITHADVFEYVMGSGVSIGDDKADLSAQFDTLSSELASKWFALEAIWQEYAKKLKEVEKARDQLNASTTWTDFDAAFCSDLMGRIDAIVPASNYCRTNFSDEAACNGQSYCSWSSCNGTGVCAERNRKPCELYDSKAACEAQSGCVVSTTGRCSTIADSGHTDFLTLQGEMTELQKLTQQVTREMDRLKERLKPIREKMHYNSNFSTVSTFNNDDQQWVVNRFYNLEDSAAQKVCEPEMENDKVKGYLNPPDGTCCADTRFYRIQPSEGRLAKVRLQRNMNDERGQRDNNCERNANGDCLVSRHNIKFSNTCASAPLPAGAVITNPEM